MLVRGQLEQFFVCAFGLEIKPMIAVVKIPPILNKKLFFLHSKLLFDAIIFAL
jgi:hypothetical protein